MGDEGAAIHGLVLTALDRGAATGRATERKAGKAAR